MVNKSPKLNVNPTLELSDFEIKFSFRRRLLNNDLNDFITKLTGHLRAFNNETERFDIPVGRIYVYRIEIARAFEEGESIWQIFDSQDAELADYYSNLFNEDDFSDDLQNIVAPGFGTDLLIVDRVEILKDFRGLNLGLILALRAIESFSDGCGYIALRPCPLQFGPYRNKETKKLQLMGYDQFSKNERQAFKNLRRHWSKIGFVPVGNSTVYIKSPALENLSIGKLFVK